ncbi:MAG: acyl-CoA dehydrogenase family protein [SAR202 cluster bacterium]|jgi:alkylation response protein AidB-like acyl-CoA dehydrogenase|nr:acyl-CoA dehydrogenase family protein [SAR202 cluster bacterium]
MVHTHLSEEESLLKSTVGEFADQVLAPRAADYDKSGEFPWSNIRELADLGMFGLTIKEEYGGSGGTSRQLSIVAEEVARGCAATSTIYIAHLSLCTRFIQLFGTIEQKRRFIPHLAKAETIGAFALTEPDSGSDAASMSTSLTQANGKYRLDGTKHFITNAEEATVFVVLATHDRSLRTKGIDALIIQRDTPGLTVNPQHGKMGIRASSTAEVVFDGCPVTEENRLGPEGKGFQECMEVLNGSRIAIASQCVGIAQAAYDAAIAYSKQREVFGKRLSEFQNTQWDLANLATNIMAARLLVYHAATLMDAGQPYAETASMAKLLASRVAVETANRALQIHGGIGYFAPTIVERLYRDAKVTEIYEGSSEVQRMIISRGIFGDV